MDAAGAPSRVDGGPGARARSPGRMHGLAGSSYAGTNRIKFSGSMASTTSQPDAKAIALAHQGSPEQAASI